MIAPPNSPSWLLLAFEDLGAREVPGYGTSPVVKRMLQTIKAWWNDDETPWCGAAVGDWMARSGFPLAPHPYRAKSWLEWGQPISRSILGSIVVLGRDGGGHVGLEIGQTPTHVILLGGNQGNSVSIASFPLSRLIGRRWPLSCPIPGSPDLSPFSQVSFPESRSES